MADLVGYLRILCLLVGCHSLKLRSELVDRLSKSFVSLSLGCYEVLHEAFYVRVGLQTLMRWVVG